MLTEVERGTPGTVVRGDHDPVVEQSVVVSPPDLHSGHLVWEDHRGNSGDVYLYDLVIE